MDTTLTYGDGEERTAATDESLRGKNCVVTGASRGIGRAIARGFARSGANVAVNYHTSADAAREVVADIESDAGADRAFAVQADVADRDDVETLADRVHEEFGAVDVLVNNAGVTIDRRFDRMTWEDWRRVLDVNLGGAFHCTQAFYDDIRAAEDGRLINVSSVVAQHGNYGQSNYAASKSALFGFTRSLARELAPSGSTANCVAPGYTRTDMVARVRDDIQSRIRERIPLDRFADAEEVAATVRFLATADASYVTGEVLNVNGGMHA
jgi:3-oxoacyl-[acyl-carrier protein] reductase